MSAWLAPWARTVDFHRDPYSTYKILRDEHPVFYDAPRRPMCLTRFADVREGARDHVRFARFATMLSGSRLGDASSGDLVGHDSHPNVALDCSRPRL